MRIQQIERRDWLDNYLDIRPGEHVNVICPTGGGKSHMLYQMLSRYMDAYPDITVASMMPKPQDSTTNRWAPALGLKETATWPPAPVWPWQEKPRGHVLWPRHIPDNEDANREHLAKVLRDAINRQYWQGNSVTFVDDAYITGVLLGLNQELDRHWIAGRSSGASLWTALQKPSGTQSGTISSFAYDSPTHLLFGRDNDDRNLKRISEIAISQCDPREIADTVRHLGTHRFGDDTVSDMLYIDRRGPYMAVIGP